jgi:hypothetical protein
MHDRLSILYYEYAVLHHVRKYSRGGGGFPDTMKFIETDVETYSTLRKDLRGFGFMPLRRAFIYKINKGLNLQFCY